MGLIFSCLMSEGHTQTKYFNHKFRVTPDQLYGTHETQLSDPEADLHQHMIGCTKNPGHTNFIPCKNLAIHHLPERYRDNDLYELIQAAAHLTVRVDVKWVSEARPMFWPDTKVPYPFYDKRGCVIMRTGSGNVRAVKYTDGSGLDGRGSKTDILGVEFSRDYKTCPCKKCRRSDNPSSVWWEIFIATAAHVVFDESEAANTACRLFYDDADSEVVDLIDLDIDCVIVEADKCELKTVLCDPLGDTLFEKCRTVETIWSKLQRPDHIRRFEKLSFIISHPHGCHKQVSIGQRVDRYRMVDSMKKCSERYDNMDKTKLTYTTCTCPGSSGAKIYCLGFTCHVHSGTLNKKLNYSSTGFQVKIKI